VGTLEFRAIQEPVRTIPGIHYHQAKAREIDVEKGVLLCEDIFKFRQFELPFDKLVIATGVKTNTFNTPGILEMENRQVCQCHVTGRFFFVGCREDDIEAAP
jgi:NADH dehydrogenase FAD-containing subunit